MMDLSTIDPAVIEARGQYATVNGEYKTLMSTMQSWAQQATDDIRRGLNEIDADHAEALFANAMKLAEALRDKVSIANMLKSQKDELWPKAWGKS